MDPTVPESERSYLVQLDNGQTVPIPLGKMPKHLPRRPSPSEGVDSVADSQLPSFLQVNQKITYEKDGVYHKGYLGRNGGMYRFVYKRHPNSKREEWGEDLPDLPATWSDLCVTGILQPGHTASSFLRGSSASTFDPVANIISAVDLQRDCPSSLMQALADSHPDREVWIQSYYEE